jgi:hypothetical protein
VLEYGVRSPSLSTPQYFPIADDDVLGIVIVEAQERALNRARADLLLASGCRASSSRVQPILEQQGDEDRVHGAIEFRGATRPRVSPGHDQGVCDLVLVPKRSAA